RRPRWRAAKAAARTSAKTFPPCSTAGRSIRRCAGATVVSISRHSPLQRSQPHRSRPRNDRHCEASLAMTATAKLKIWRGRERQGGQWVRYDVAFEAGQSVLDGLRWIRVNADPTLAIRFSCINANACKECMIELDGRTVYACTARLEPREMTLAP